MLFKNILKNYDGKFKDTEISDLTCDSRKITKNCAFVCIKGANFDGHDAAKQAVSDGAAVVVTERDMGIENQVIVKDTHEALSLMAANWFGNPASKMKMIGITGTNGKTSVTYMLKSILEKAGNKVGLIGTVQNMIGDRTIESVNTTPGAFELHKLFAEMYNSGCNCVVMEVSSHALSQKRVFGFMFDVAVFTNLTEDHLDYHITMENYMEAKKTLFSMCRVGIFNKDDEYFKAISDGVTCKCVSVSAVENTADYFATDISYRPDGVDYDFNGKGKTCHMHILTGGRFSVYNSMSAAAAASELGLSDAVISDALSRLKGVVGRAEVVNNDLGFTIIIDYAHTPDGLENILKTFKECPKNKLTVVFGCGGDRDSKKRPIMGEIAVRYADNVIVTSDNPRTEEPVAIIQDILQGMKDTETPYKVIENRIDAIKYAVKTAEKNDIIVLAGKGHETYQILKTGKIHLDEREVVAEAIKEIKGE